MTTLHLGSRVGADATDFAELKIDLDALDPISAPVIIEVDNDAEVAETTIVTFSDISQDVTNTITIRPKSGEGFASGIGSGKLQYDASYGAAITVSNGGPICTGGFWFWEDLMVKSTGGYQTTYDTKADGAIKRMIVERTANGGTLMVASVRTLVENSLFYRSDNGGSTTLLIRYGNATKIINCTLLQPSSTGDAKGIEGSYASGHSIHQSMFLLLDGDDVGGGGTAPSGDYNISNKTNANTDIPDDNTTSAYSVTPASELVNISSTANMDARTKSGGTAEGFIPSGSKDGDTPSDDILGQTRTGNIDCGCYQIQVAGGPPPHMFTRNNLGLGGLGGGMIA